MRITFSITDACLRRGRFFLLPSIPNQYLLYKFLTNVFNYCPTPFFVPKQLSKTWSRSGLILNRYSPTQGENYGHYEPLISYHSRYLNIDLSKEAFMIIFPFQDIFEDQKIGNRVGDEESSLSIGENKAIALYKQGDLIV